jgi:murein L,D-transpeptidase YcbB/YkuD
MKGGLALLCFVVMGVGAQEPPSPSPVQIVRREIMAGGLQGASHGDMARYRPALLRVYADSTARGIWFADARLTRQAEVLLAELGAAEKRGLRPSDYDAEPLARTATILRAGTPDATRGAELLRIDAWLTLSAMRFMDHAHRGRADPRSLGFAFPSAHGQHDHARLVVALSRSPDVHAMLDSLEPPFTRFRALEGLLSRYRTLAADSTLRDLPRISSSVRPGERWNGMPALQRLLVALGDIPATTAPSLQAESDSFGDALVDGVKHFQRRHGLAPDGTIGTATLAQLRTPLSERIVQIELTMERWRWLPDITSPRLVVVNIPAFRLYAFDRTMAEGGQRLVERMDVIVRSAYRRRHTPVFTGEVRDVVFHPYWDVPASIARNEEIPHLRRDPGYAEREGLEIVRGGDVGATVYPISDANLQQVAAGTLRLRQRPGPRNALGSVKFVFPNQYNVYLHGTPAQSLFARTRRDFSHGCIRVSDPARLAEFVLKGQVGWDSARIAEAMGEAGGLLRVTLDRPLPVYILYATAVTDDDGVAFFYADLYGHDPALARALR